MKYTKEILQEAVNNSHSIYGVLRYLGTSVISGGMHNHIKQKIIGYGIDTSHFTGCASNCGKGHIGGKKRLSSLDLLVYNRSGEGRKEIASRLRRALDDIGRKRICTSCGLGETWQGLPLVLEIDHINGNPLDNREENLQYKCPNCHSQTSNFGKQKRHRKE